MPVEQIHEILQRMYLRGMATKEHFNLHETKIMEVMGLAENTKNRVSGLEKELKEALEAIEKLEKRLDD